MKLEQLPGQSLGPSTKLGAITFLLVAFFSQQVVFTSEYAKN